MRSAWALPCWWRSSCCWESSWWIRLRRLELSLSELRSYKCTPRQWVHSEHLSVISLNHFLRPAIVFLQGCKWCPWKKWQLYQLINAHCPMLKHTNTHQQKKIIHLFNPGTEHSLHPDCQGILLRKTWWPLPQSTLGSPRYLGYSTMFSESMLLKSAKHEGSWGGSLGWSW